MIQPQAAPCAKPPDACHAIYTVVLKYQIKFLLGENDYFVSTCNKFTITKEFETQLSNSEIDKIVNSEVKRHKDFIEQKIADKENN